MRFRAMFTCGPRAHGDRAPFSAPGSRPQPSRGPYAPAGRKRPSRCAPTSNPFGRRVTKGKTRASLGMEAQRAARQSPRPLLNAHWTHIRSIALGRMQPGAVRKCAGTAFRSGGSTEPAVLHHDRQAAFDTSLKVQFRRRTTLRQRVSRFIDRESEAAQPWRCLVPIEGFVCRLPGGLLGGSRLPVGGACFPRGGPPFPALLLRRPRSRLPSMNGFPNARSASY